VNEGPILSPADQSARLVAPVTFLTAAPVSVGTRAASCGGCRGAEVAPEAPRQVRQPGRCTGPARDGILPRTDPRKGALCSIVTS